jgi:hypothetical protein
MNKVFISQIDKLEDFDIVELIDDETREFKGYYLDSSYKKAIEDLLESEKEPRVGWDEKFKDRS